MKKILFYGDSPVVATGLGNVTKHILRALYATGNYEIEVIGINHFQDWTDLPYNIWSNAGRDALNMTLAKTLIPLGDYDILFLFNDCDVLNNFIGPIKQLKANMKNKTIPERDIKIVMYSPIDNDKISVNDMWSFAQVDVPVTYTRFGYDVITGKIPVLKDKLQIIGHGCDPSEIYPLPKKKMMSSRCKNTSLKRDTFLITNVNRNQPRKNLVGSLMAFKIFSAKHDNAMIYFHCKMEDTGGNLKNQAEAVGIDPNKILFTNDTFDNNIGLPVSYVNYVYGISDVIISTTLGEGWGLSLSEAMSAKRPVIFPNNSSITEIIGAKEERGLLVPSGLTNTDWMTTSNGKNLVWPVTDVDLMVLKLEQVYKDRKLTGVYEGKTKQRIEEAYEWSQKNTWETVGNQWINLLDKLYEK